MTWQNFIEQTAGLRHLTRQTANRSRVTEVVASASALKIGTAGTSTIVDLWNKAMRCKLSAVRMGEEWEILVYGKFKGESPLF